MKALVCEMCGSHNVVKQDGVFVCQACDTKYSVEEARKMMIEGSVQIDRSNEIENRLTNIENEYSVGHMKECFQLCLELLNIDPDNVTAIIYKALADGWTSSTQNSKINSTGIELNRAIKIAAKNSKSVLEYMIPCTLVIASFKELCETMMDAYVQALGTVIDNTNQIAKMTNAELNRLKKMDYTMVNYAMEQGEKSMARLRTAQNKLNESQKQTAKQIESILAPFSNVVTTVFNEGRLDWVYTDEFIDMVCDQINSFKGLINKMSESIPISSSAKSKYQSLPDEIIKMHSDRKAVLQKQMVDAYWAEHAEEKAALDAELNLIKKQIDSVNIQLNQINQENEGGIENLNRRRNDMVPAEFEQKQCDERINELQNQLNKLGIFKGKQKKEVQSQIDSENEKKSRILKMVDQQRAELAAEVDKQIKQLNAKLKPYQKQLKELNQKKHKIENKLNSIPKKKTKP